MFVSQYFVKTWFYRILATWMFPILLDNFTISRFHIIFPVLAAVSTKFWEVLRESHHDNHMKWRYLVNWKGCLKKLTFTQNGHYIQYFFKQPALNCAHEKWEHNNWIKFLKFDRWKLFFYISFYTYILID